MFILISYSLDKRPEVSTVRFHTDWGLCPIIFWSECQICGNRLLLGPVTQHIKHTQGCRNIHYRHLTDFTNLKMQRGSWENMPTEGIRILRRRSWLQRSRMGKGELLQILQFVYVFRFFLFCVVEIGWNTELVLFFVFCCIRSFGKKEKSTSSEMWHCTKIQNIG